MLVTCITGALSSQVRMSLEMAAALAFVLNRTLVLPPMGGRIYLRGKSEIGDYFDLGNVRTH